MSEADPGKILGYGAIGLGFLLAVLAYRLLSRENFRERPIYVYLVFCLLLVIVGSTLQYVAAKDNTVAVLEREKQLTLDLEATKKQLAEAVEKQQTAQNEANRYKSDLSRLVDAVAGSLAIFKGEVTGNMFDLNNFAVNDSCPGGGNGVPSNHSGDIQRVNTLIAASISKIVGLLTSVQNIAAPQP